MLKEQLQNDLKEAMKAKDTVRLNTVRMIKKYLLELETAPGHQGDATDEEILKIINKLVKQGRDTAATYQQAGRTDLFEEESKQVSVLEAYLPKQLSEDEIRAEIAKVMAELGLNQMGPLMKELNARLAGRADGKTISNLVRAALQ